MRINDLNALDAVVKKYFIGKKMVLIKSFDNLTVGKVYDCAYFGLVLTFSNTKIFSVVNDNNHMVEVPETHFISIEENREDKINNILNK